MSDADFEHRVARSLRAPVPAMAASRDTIMARVRQVPASERPRRTLALYGRSVRQSIIGLAFAAGIGSITALSTLSPGTVATARTAGVVTSVVIGDTVFNRLRDTLRLVRLMFNDSSAQQVALAGDFNAWDERHATRMHRDARTGHWTATVALRDGEHRYAILVDKTRRPGRLYVTRSTD